MNLIVGHTVQNSRYLINHSLGSWCQESAWQATDLLTRQPVVIKTLLGDRTKVPPELHQQFLKTAQQFAACRHPALAHVLSVFSENDQPFAVFDYTAGQTLAELVQANGSLSEKQAVQYIRQVSSALSAVHQAELVHGRVAPSTIVCPAHSEIAVLTNPSLLPGVSSRDADLDCDPYAAIGLTQARSLTPAADGYALAATLYFVVTGQPPLSARLRQTQPLVPPRQLQPDLSQAVESAILAGMELALANRPGTVADWLALLPSDLPDSAVGKGTSALPISTAATVLETALESEVGTTGKAPRSSFSQANGGTIATSSDRKDSAFSTKVQPSLPTQGEEPVPNGRVATEPVQPQPATLPAVRKPKSKPASRSNAATNQRFSRMVMTGATIAAIAGLGFGLTLRLVLNRNPALSPFNLDQTFPTLKNSNQPPSIPWPEPVFDQEPTQPD